MHARQAPASTEVRRGAARAVRAGMTQRSLRPPSAVLASLALLALLTGCPEPGPVEPTAEAGIVHRPRSSCPADGLADAAGAFVISTPLALDRSHVAAG